MNFCFDISIDFYYETGSDEWFTVFFLQVQNYFTVFSSGTSITATPINTAPYKSTRGYQQSIERDTGINVRSAAAINDGKGIMVQYTSAAGGVNPSRTLLTVYPENCSAGTFGRTDGSCLACPVGKYSLANQPCISGCQICPDGTFTDTEGASSCTPCPAGTYDDISYYPSNSSSCKPCPGVGESLPPMPLRQQAIDYCNNGGARSYTGGAYATYNAWSIECAQWTFLGLTQDQWMQVSRCPIA